MISAVLENPHCKLEDLRLIKCGVTDEGCAALASALRSNPSHLRKLILSGNKLGDSGVKMFSAVLENPHCKLEDLGLGYCGVTDEGCAALASALRSNPSHLRNLDLSGNKLGDSTVKLFSAVLENPHCKLEALRRLRQPRSSSFYERVQSQHGSRKAPCKPSSSSPVATHSSTLDTMDEMAALPVPTGKMAAPSELKDIGGIPAIESAPEPAPTGEPSPQPRKRRRRRKKAFLILQGSEAFQEPAVGPETTPEVSPAPPKRHALLRDCGVTDEGCAALASALRSNPSHLRKLELSRNNLGDSGVKLFSAVLENPHCKLQELRLMDCGVTDEGCAALASALRSNPSHLRHLDLSRNKLGDSAVKLLSDLENDPHYKLETLCT
ncbi:ribonuclease inhibitor-like [Megalobrama amblycephala]|uniref:ribonuclease inhibitor-like n=1 Tax=Megalobrama amblycephala TaxID=75352 RepID=UPI00201445C7|nr:ribonuclease inhibitor-like [Megalobrama amblycephala]